MPTRPKRPSSTGTTGPSTHFGGTPARVRYDNLKPAVARVLMGRNRLETERFVALRSHYLFESFYCRPGKDGAHEKGGVEGEIGRFRRRHMVPVPKVSSMAELNELVAEGDRLDDIRRIDARRISVAEHFALEFPHLRPLPAEPFDAGSAASTPGRRQEPGLRAPVLLFGPRALCRHAHRRAPGGRVRRSARRRTRRGPSRPGRRQGGRDPRPRPLPRDPEHQARRALRVDRTAPGPGLGSLQRRPTTASSRRPDAASATRDGTKALIGVLLAHRVLPYDAVVAGIEGALAVGSLDPDVVIVEARRATEHRDLGLADLPGLARFDRPTPTLDRYDDLLEGSG